MDYYRKYLEYKKKYKQKSEWYDKLEEAVSIGYLEFNNKQIDDAGVEVIAKNLDNNKFTQLCINNNNIGTDGAEKIANALKEKNYTLKYLSLERNNISEDILDNIFTYLERNREQLVKSSYKK